MKENTRDYYVRREAEERAAAEVATSREARASHLLLAYHYAARLGDLAETDGVMTARMRN
jgi:hypothetical protein